MSNIKSKRYTLLGTTALVALATGPVHGFDNPIDEDRIETVGMGETEGFAVDLFVGQGTPGTLIIQGGGTVSVAGTKNVSIGDGTQGTVTVTGTAGGPYATLNANSAGSSIYVGRNEDGDGTLEIFEGGRVLSNRDVLIGSGHGSAQGHVTIGGEDSLLDVGRWLAVGDHGIGTLEITDEATVDVGSEVLIGWKAGSDGTVTMTGADAKMDITNTLYVGHTGTGSLEIGGGSSVEVGSDTWIGRESGSVGTLTVTGGGSSLATGQDLTVGQSGTGTLTISDGGSIEVDRLVYIGRSSGGEGSVTVTGAGSDLTLTGENAAGNLIVGSSGEGSLDVRDGGTVNVDSDLRVGSSAAGTMIIAQGGSVTVQGDAIVGQFSGSVGSSATVDGAGSSWTVHGGGGLIVGRSTNATLEVTSGGAVTVDEALTLGFFADVTGTALVSGPDATVNSDSLTVGSSGSGDLTIEDGGHVESSTVTTIGGSDGSEGTVTVDGDGSTLVSNSRLSVGWSGTGSLTVTSGGSVSANDVHIGRSGTSAGTVVVSGAGSQLHNTSTGNLIIGDSGTGGEDGDNSLEISDGGQVIVGSKTLGTVIIAQNASSTGTLYIGAEAGGGAGTLDAGQIEAGSGTATLEFRHSDDGYAFATTKGDGIALTGGLAIRHSGSGETELAGRVTTTGNAGLQVTGGTLAFRHADAGNSIGGGTATVTVGDGTAGTGTLAVENGATLRIGEMFHTGATLLIQGDGDDGVGIVQVSGAESELIVHGNTFVGRDGDGSLRIEHGGRFTGEDGLRALVVGDTGTGTVTISDAGVAEMHNLIVASGEDSVGTVILTGAGSTLTANNDVTIGDEGAGALEIRDGATMTVGDDFDIADSSGSTGTVLVTGDGSSLAVIDEDLIVGGAGTGTLTVEQGGSVTVADDFVVAERSGSAGSQATVTGQGSTLTVEDAAEIGKRESGSLTVSDTGAMTVGETLAIGSRNQGTLTVSSGGTVVADEAVLLGGDSVTRIDARGTATVGGSGSHLQANATDQDNIGLGHGIGLVVGYAGEDDTNSLEISDGGRVTVGSDGGGTVQIARDGNVTGALYIGAEAGGGAGTLDAAEVRSGAGTATLEFRHSDEDYAFATTGGDGIALNGRLVIRHSGSGETALTGLVTTMNAGAQVTGGTLAFRYADSQNSIAGINAEVTVGDGTAGTGTLAVETGSSLRIGEDGQLGATLRVQGDGDDGVGTVRVSGAESELIVRGNTIVGQNGDGSLRIEQGGSLTSVNGLVIANAADGAGSVDVTGAGSELISLDHLVVGETGSGTLAVADGGAVRVDKGSGTLQIAQGEDSVGTLVIGSAVGQAAVGAGVLEVGGLALGDGAAHLVFNHSDGDYRFRNAGDSALTGEGWTSLRHLGSGTTVLDQRVEADSAEVAAGTLTLSHDDNSFGAAGITVSGGTLSLLADGAAGGAGGSITTTGSTVHLGNKVTNAAAITLASDGTRLRVDATETATQSGAIAEQGEDARPLEILGGGTLVLTGAASHSGTTTVSAGSLRIGAGGTAGSLAGDVTLGEDASLAFDRADDVTFAGALSGDGQLLQAGAGATTLTGDASHSGGTTVSAGSLRIGAGGTAGSLAGDVALGQSTALVFDRADSLAFAGAISGDGQLIQAGTGTTILGGVAAHSGGTSIQNGTLQLGGDDRLSGAGMLTVETAGTFALAEFNQTVWSLSGDGVIDLGSGVLTVVNEADLDFLGSLLGSGRLTVAGAGTLTLVEDSSYTGGTVVDEGTLQFGTGGTSGSLTGDATVAAGAVLAFNRSDQLAYAGAVGGAGMLFQRGSGTLLLSGDSSYSGGTRLDSGTLAVGHDNALGTGTLFANGGALRAAGGSRTLANAIAITADSLQLTGAHALTLAGPLSGDGALTVAVEDDAAITLTGAASHGGGTTVQSGSLRIGAGGTSGSLAGDVALGENGTLAFDRADALTLAGAISGDGGLRQVGTGTTTLSGQIAVAGGLEVANGTLALGHDGNSFGDAGITVSGGTLSLLADGAAGGADGAITTTGSTVHLADGVTNATAVTLDSDSTRLRVEAGETATQAGAIGQANGSARPLEIAGGGTLIFTADNSYSGLTTVAAGTLQLGAGSGGGTSGGFGGDALIADGATLAINRADDILYDGAIAGAGTLRQIGTGTTTLAGALDMTGTLDLVAGGMVVDSVGGIAGGTAVGSDAWLRLTDGASLQSHASVAGRLTGTGTLGGFSIGSGGTLRPGAADMPGTLTVTGDADFAAGSVYHVYLNATAHSRTNIGGSLSIAGGTVQVTSLLAASPEAHATVLDTPRRILQAEDGVTGQFDELSINYAFLTPELLYGADFVDLVLRFDTDPVDPDPVDPDPVDPDPVDPDPVDPDPVDPDPVDPDPVDPDPVDPPGPPAPPQIQASVQNQLNQLPSISANQQSVTNVLGSMRADDPRYQAFVDRLIQVQTDQVSGVVEGLSGSSLGASSGIAPALAGSMLSFIQQQSGVGGQSPSMAQSGVGTLQFASLGASQPGDRPQLSQAMPAPAIDGISRGAVWIRAVGRTGRLGQANGLPGASTRSGGVHAGLEMPVSDNLLVGGALGYEAGRTSTLGADAHVDTTMASAALYGRYAADGLRVSGAAEASWIDHKSVRAIPVFGEQEGRYAARALVFDLEAAYDLARAAPGVTLAPLAGFRFTSLDQDGYEETGTAPLRVEGYTTQSARVRLGGEARFDFAAMGSGPAVLTARAAWSREIGSPTTAVRASLLGSDTFSIRGQALPENLLEGGLTLDVDISENLQLFGAYNATLGTRFDTHQLQAGLRLRW